MRTVAVTMHVLQAYLAVNPASPRWCDVTFSAVDGWKDYQKWEKGRLVRDSRLEGSSGWQFVSAESGREVLAELLSRYRQEHHLRVIQRYETVHEQFIGGADIQDGKLVLEPSGKRVANVAGALSVPRYLGVSRSLPSSVSASSDVLDRARGAVQDMGDYLSGRSLDARDLIQRAHDVLQGIVSSSQAGGPR